MGADSAKRVPLRAERARDRVPVRAGPGHAHRGHGGHRSRRQAGITNKRR